MKSQVRIGIDVGGTFTDAVAIDSSTYEILAKTKVPTTHHAKKGVAEGIILAINKILEEGKIDPSNVVFIAHGTTQATNALLEGDVAKVGIIGMGTGLEGERAKKETRVGDIELAPGKYLRTVHTFLDSARLTDDGILKAVRSLRGEGAQVIVASEAYSVDDPDHEKHVIEKAFEENVPATGGYEISQLYGLLARTRTAVVNAALIPKMMETADMTGNAVHEAKIDKPLMIMRCDGGVMSVDEVRKRPILTMLSGLAAGVAGALMYEKITDGIFLEAGGTSIDISAIKDGKVMIKNAEIGGRKLYLTSLDVHTLGVAGGSMIVVRNGAVSDVGPRSAHIADLEYEVFTDPALIANPHLELIAPREGDKAVYAAVSCDGGRRYALTLAGAANLLGYVPENDYAHGNVQAARAAWGALATELGVSAEEAARAAMDIAADKVSAVVNALIDDYGLNRSIIYLVGGGGSASVIVPYLGEKMGIRHKIARNAPYISTIGVAMALMMERLERSVVNPGPEDIRKLRNDVTEMIVKSGANPDTVEISVEIDTQKSIIRAVATGATELRTKNVAERRKTPDEMAKIVAESAGVKPQDVSLAAQTGGWYAFTAVKTGRALFGLIKTKKELVRMVDSEGVIRLQKNNAKVVMTKKKNLPARLSELIEELTVYNAGGSMLPRIFLYFRQKNADLSGVTDKEQMMSLAEQELEFVDDEEAVIAVAAQG